MIDGGGRMHAAIPRLVLEFEIQFRHDLNFSDQPAGDNFHGVSPMMHMGGGIACLFKIARYIKDQQGRIQPLAFARRIIGMIRVITDIGAVDIKFISMTASMASNARFREG
jgi:hypothetical protein